MAIPAARPDRPQHIPAERWAYPVKDEYLVIPSADGIVTRVFKLKFDK
jgi:hypothetical protein